MTKKKSWFVFAMVVCLLILGALACVFPTEVVIDGGLFPSAIDEGYAKLDVAKAGCDCETSVVTGRVKYTDGRGPDKVHFTGKVDHILNPGCEIPEDTNLWATGTYNPGKGTFNIGLFGPNHADYDVEKCADCELCWRLWLVGGKFDGYQNWACGLENEDALTYVEHPPDSACGSD
jgi:hypothetical protein